MEGRLNRVAYFLHELAISAITTIIIMADAIAHNKIMMIDEETVITGSFNFTKAAQEHNAENLVVIKDKALAIRYMDNWKAHKKHSEPYTKRGTR